MAFTIRENEALAKHTVFKIGGSARFFAEAETAEDFVSVLKAAVNLGTPWVILGAGSNVLVSDRGVDSMVIRWNGGNIKIDGEKLTADAPVAMARVASESLRAGLRGFEWGVGIPGTVGGSVRGNAGCFGGEMKDVIESVEVFDTSDGKIKNMPKIEAGFGYRTSVFKYRPELAVLSAMLGLKRGSEAEGRELVRGYTLQRSKSQDIGSMSAGCIFKNVLWERWGVDREKLISRFPELARFRDSPGISSGFLIDQAGLKGFAVGGARVSDRHGNFFINAGNATAKDVVILIGITKERVRKKYGLLLEEEIQYLGFA